MQAIFLKSSLWPTSSFFYVVLGFNFADKLSASPPLSLGEVVDAI
jgi:hypothetical protein